MRTRGEILEGFAGNVYSGYGETAVEKNEYTYCEDDEDEGQPCQYRGPSGRNGGEGFGPALNRPSVAVLQGMYLVPSGLPL